MKKYFLFPASPPLIRSDSVVLVNEDGSISFIPVSESNMDYQEYLAWLAEGNTPEEWTLNAD